MSAPTPTSTARTHSRGYLVSCVGALLGVLLLGGIGVGIGAGLAELYYDPDAGLANLGLLVFPIGLGGIGILLGMFLGVRTALRRAGDELASATAWMTVPVAVLGLGLLFAWGTGIVVLLATPATARWLALRTAERDVRDTGRRDAVRDTGRRDAVRDTERDAGGGVAQGDARQDRA